MTNPATLDDSITAGRLRYDHRSFDLRLEAMRVRAKDVGWAVVAPEWSGFCVDVVRHAAFEELAVFPTFARHKPGAAVVVVRLIDEHDDLRHLLDVLTATIAAGSADACVLDTFKALMDSHEERENTRIDPWLELQNRRSQPRGAGVGARSRR